MFVKTLRDDLSIRIDLHKQSYSWRRNTAERSEAREASLGTAGHRGAPRGIVGLLPLRLLGQGSGNISRGNGRALSAPRLEHGPASGPAQVI